MGPVQTRHIGGRGDKLQSSVQTLDYVVKNDLDLYIAKYHKLDAEAKAELQALFDDEDVEQLLADEYVKEMAGMFIQDALYDPEDRK